MLPKNQKNQHDYSRDLRECLSFTRDELLPVKLFTKSPKGKLQLWIGTGLLILGGLLNVSDKIVMQFWPSTLAVLAAAVFLWWYMHLRFKIPVPIGISDALGYMRCKALRSFLINIGYKNSDEVRKLYSMVENDAKMSSPNPSWHALAFIGVVCSPIPGLCTEFLSKHAKPGVSTVALGLLPIAFLVLIYAMISCMKLVRVKRQSLKTLQTTLWELLSDGYAFPDDSRGRTSSR